MPVVSEKSRILKVLVDRMLSKAIKEALESSEEEDCATGDFNRSDGSKILDFSDNEISIPVIRRLVDASRYSVARESTPKSFEFVSLVFPQLKERQIKQELRMNWTAFQEIAFLIEDHPVYYL